MLGKAFSYLRIIAYIIWQNSFTSRNLYQYLYNCFLFPPLLALPRADWSWSKQNQALKEKADPGHFCIEGTEIPAILCDKLKYCSALSRLCFRAIVRIARVTGVVYGWISSDSSTLSNLSSWRISSELTDWLPKEPWSAIRFSAQVRWREEWEWRASMILIPMFALTQTVRLCLLIQQILFSQSEMKICRSWDSSSGSHWIRSKRGWTLLMPKIPTEVWSPSTACKAT